MNLYSNGKRHILVPSVVGGVIGAERALTIRVTVVDEAGNALKARQAVVDDEPAANDTQTADEFFRTKWAKFPPTSRQACTNVVDVLRQSNVAGLRVEHLKNGRPCVTFDTEGWGKVKVLRVANIAPALRDNLDSNSREMKGDRTAISLWNDFRRSLLEVKGARLSKTHVY